MIIDVRCRPPVPELGGPYWVDRAKDFGGYGVNTAFAGGTMEAFFEEIGSVGITTAVAACGNNPGMRIGSRMIPARTASNDVMADLNRRYWGRFYGVMGVDAGNVLHNALDEIDRGHRLGLRAVFIEPGRSPGCNLDDRRLYPIYEKCVELDLALFPQTSGVLGGAYMEYADPRYLDRVAHDFPQLRVVAGHAFYPYAREAIVMAGRHENVYLAPDVCVLYLGGEDWVKAINRNLHGLREKFLFGSAYPGHPLKQYMEEFFALPWDKAALPNMMYRNALRALKLQEDPVFSSMYPER